MFVIPTSFHVTRCIVLEPVVYDIVPSTIVDDRIGERRRLSQQLAKNIQRLK
jgi:hypothetical protein